MTDLVLTRWWTDASAQVGRLAYPGGECFTLEPPWLWNRQGRSCIPCGLYRIERDTFRGEYPNFRVDDVIGRTAIELHIGNRPEDTHGCILLGSQLGFRPAPWLVASKAAFDRFMQAMEGAQSALLSIVGPFERAVAGGNST